MKMTEYSKLETNLRKSRFDTTLVPVLLLLLSELKELLFVKGKYKEIKWHQWRRLYGIAKAAVRLVNTLMGIIK
tara:strand:- start:287 stop:508 length:222 start_codon:yes stop_codon:yes gene_type:complete